VDVIGLYTGLEIRGMVGKMKLTLSDLDLLVNGLTTIGYSFVGATMAIIFCKCMGVL